MIPKILHYCWLSGDSKPKNIIGCMESWQKTMPDYEIKCWDTTNFDTNINAFVSEAYSLRKWAFAADYIRLWVLYNEGGIYLDSDVLVLKRFDEFLKYEFFSSVEYHKNLVKKEESLKYLDSDGTRRKEKSNISGIGIQAAVLGSVKNNQYVKACMNYYENRHFILEGNELNNNIIAPDIYAMTAEEYGFKYKDEMQQLGNNMVIMPSYVFASSPEIAKKDSYAIHYCVGSWRDKPKESGLRNIFKRIKSYFYR